MSVVEKIKLDYGGTTGVPFWKCPKCSFKVGDIGNGETVRKKARVHLLKKHGERLG